jgi:hypothetical protein
VSVRNTPQNKSRAKHKAGKRVQSGRSGRGFWVLIAVVIVIGIAAVVAVASGTKKTTTAAQPASAALLAKVTSVPKTVFDKVGAGTAQTTPKPITAPALTANGKPQIVYMGAEYCPYCAVERWPMVVALSKFGTFSDLKVTNSSITDVPSDIQTFSFHGATYTSKWITFTGTEMQSNERQGDGYATLDKPTAEEQRLIDTYDRPPYIGTGSGGGIPFIDFGGKFLISGATYDAGLLVGKNHNQIADALADPTSTISQGAIGVANTFTAAICSLTGDQPSNVCSNSTIQNIKSALK